MQGWLLMSYFPLQNRSNSLICKDYITRLPLISRGYDKQYNYTTLLDRPFSDNVRLVVNFSLSGIFVTKF